MSHGMVVGRVARALHGIGQYDRDAGRPEIIEMTGTKGD